MTPLPRSLGSAFVVASLLVTSCGGGSVSKSADVSGGVAPVSDSEGPADPSSADVEALVNETLSSFDPDNLDAFVAQAAALDRTVELDMAEWSGLEAALGGGDSTSAAFASQDQFYAAFTDAVTAPPQLGFRRIQADGPSIGMGLFGGLMVVGLGSKAIVQGGNDGSTGTATPTEGFTITATAESVEMAVDLTHESDGLTTKLKTNVKILPCPDVNGDFTVEATVDVSASAGGKQQSGKLDVKVTGQLNDNAELASSSTDIRLKRDGLGMGSFVDSSISYASDGTATTKLNDFNWFTTKPEDFSSNAQLAAIFGLLIKQYLLDAVAAGYLSGRCVEIGYGVSPGTTGLEPGSSATITARPRGKQDGVPTGGTVQALLSAGANSVDPSSTPIPVDAEFEYGAPDEPNKTGTVSLEARSKRGVGRADISFDTKQTAYLVDAMWGDFALNGSICEAGRPFRLDATSSDGSLIMNFTWTGETAGSIEFAGNVDVAVITGTGTFVVELDGEGGTLSIVTTGTGVMEGLEVPTFVDSTTFPLQAGGDCT